MAAIIADVLHGLHAAHEATSEKGEPLDIVHRDVSPQNVLVGADGVARVLDFGVAKAAGRIQTTREGQLKGKIAYMAPEQLTGVASRRTDVYAASVVLWEALTGRRLFRGENDAAVLNQVMHAAIAPPSQHVEGLDPAFDAIVIKGLEREAERRYATAREMALALEARLQLARATEVGAWVESLVSDALAKRAAEVTSVESASDVEVVPAEPSSIASQPSSVSRTASASRRVDAAPRATVPDSPPVAAESVASRISAVSWPLHAAPKPARRPRMALAAAIGVGAVVAVAVVLLVTRSATQGKDAPAPSAAETALARTPSVEPAATSPPAAPPAPAPSVTAATSASAPVAVSSAQTAPVAPAGPARPPRAGRPRGETAPAGTKAPTLGGVLDTRR